MCSDRWLEDREFQFDLAALQSKQSNAVTTTVTILSAAAAFAILELPLPPSTIKIGAIIASLVLALMALRNMIKAADEIKQEKQRIHQKYIDNYKLDEKDEKQ